MNDPIHRLGPACQCPECRPLELPQGNLRAILMLISMWSLVLLALTGGHFLNRWIHG